MLAERLNEVAFDLHSFAESNSLLLQLDKVVTSIRQLRRAQQTDSDSTQIERVREQLEEFLATFYSTLQNDPSNKFTPTEASTLREIGGWYVSGDRLRERVETALQAPALEADQVIDEVSGLQEETQAFYDALETLLTAFGRLEVGRSTIPSGDMAEVGISYPVAMGEATLSDLYEELCEWDNHLGWFAQVGGVTPGKVRVRAIGSSGWEIFLETPFGQAAMIAIAVERTLLMLKHVADLKEKWDSLRSAGSTTEITDELIEEDARNALDEQKDELVEDLLNKHPGDPGRANEIRMPLREAVDFLVKKAREGGTVEVRVIPPADEEQDEEIAPGMGNLRDMQRRGRAMAGDDGEGLRLPRDTVALLRAATEQEEEGAEVDEGDGAAGEGEETEGTPEDTETDGEVPEGDEAPADRPD